MVSVIIPAYNTEHYIGEILECVISQTYKRLQIIVIDDGSTDKTREVIRGYQKSDPRIELVESQKGLSRARNIGIDKAEGEKIFFWDSDDIIENTAVERIVDFSYNENVNSVLYGYSSYIDGIKGQPFSHKLKKVFRKGNC